MPDVATSLLDALAQVGVRYIFGIPGDAINGLVDAVRRHDEIEFVTVRHEEAGAFAASAMAKLTGVPGVVAGTAGPGAIHLLNGLYDAKMDGAPILAITGQVETSSLGTYAHQEVAVERLVQDVAVFSTTIVNPEQMPVAAHNAIREALARRGVSVLVLPSDIALTDVEPRPFHLPIRVPPGIDPAVIDEAAAVLNEGEAVTVLIGIGAAGASDRVVEAASRLQAPIIKALRAKDVIADDHPLVIGGLGLLGTTPAVEAIDRTDVLLMIGTDFPYPEFYPEDAKCVQIDIDPTHIGRRIPVDVGVVGDATVVMDALIPLLHDRESSAHLEKAQSGMREWLAELEVAEGDDAMPMRPQRLAATISRHTQPGTIFVCDTGAVTAWAARHLTLKEGDRFTLSSSLASMAFALPGAIGAQLAYPDRPVVALTGDGGFSMLIGDLMTAVDLRLPITVVVFNNSKLGLIQVEQESEGLPEHATELANPDLARVAAAMGAEGFRVERVEDLDGAVQAALASARPSVVDVVIDPEEITMPPEIEARLVSNYARAKVRELIGGDDAMPGIRSALRQTIERLSN